MTIANMTSKELAKHIGLVSVHDHYVSITIADGVWKQTTPGNWTFKTTR